MSEGRGEGREGMSEGRVSERRGEGREGVSEGRG